MVAIELAYINTKHPDFADACGVMNNNIEVRTHVETINTLDIENKVHGSKMMEAVFGN